MISNYKLFITLSEITAAEILKFDHIKLTKVQRELSGFLSACMSRIDLLSTKYVQDFLNFDITGALSLTTITDVNDSLPLACYNLFFTNT